MNGAPSEVSAERVAAAIARMPYAKFIGIQFEVKGDELTLVMPFQPLIVGNPVLPAIHGGVLGALLEITAIAQIAALSGLPRTPKPIGVTIEFLRGGRPVATYARAHVSRIGRRIATARAEAWQANRADPIASLTGSFMLRTDDAKG